jgi:hypothetical protein
MPDDELPHVGAIPEKLSLPLEVSDVLASHPASKSSLWCQHEATVLVFRRQGIGPPFVDVRVQACADSFPKVIAHELQQSLVSLRLSNVYDLSSKILLFKFAKADNKKQLVLDTGFRCHLTEFARTTAAAPSAFVARLRKFLKTRRVTSVSQVGTDRILEFVFSDGQYRLFLEFFAVRKMPSHECTRLSSRDTDSFP